MSDKDLVTQSLARFHYETLPEITEIFRLTAPDRENLPSEPIKLLEVNPETVATGIMPLAFPPIPASGVYPSVIVEVTPDELARVQAGELKLPNSWQIAAAALPKC